MSTPLTWSQGRSAVDQLITEGRVERVPPSRDQADLLISQARNHLTSAQAVASSDPEGGYAMAYDACRKAMAAVLENEGLRVTSMRGHHLALYEVVSAQLDPPTGPQLRPFKRMHRRRGQAEYPSRDVPSLTSEDVLEDTERAGVIVDVCERVLDHMPVF